MEVLLPSSKIWLSYTAWPMSNFFFRNNNFLENVTGHKKYIKDFETTK
jgi:hypothetical protein